MSIGFASLTRVVRPVTEHLVSQRSANFWKVFLRISCPNRNCSPPIFAPTESWIVEKDEEMSQMWPFKVGGVKWWKPKTTKHLEDYYRTPKKVFEVSLLPLWFKDDLYIIRLRSYSTLNHLNWTRNEKFMSIESKRCRREEKSVENLTYASYSVTFYSTLGGLVVATDISFLS
jgi:hypothetical protein